MFNPFQPFKPEYINGLVDKGQLYLVSQTFYQHKQLESEVKKIQLLVSEYDDLGLARGHMNTLKEDKYASVIHLQKPAHAHKLLSMLTGSEYQIWWNIVLKREQIEKRLNKKYETKIRRWIMHNTTWRIGADKTITPAMQVIYGEIYIILKYYKESRTIKLDEIEAS